MLILADFISNKINWIDLDNDVYIFAIMVCLFFSIDSKK